MINSLKELFPHIEENGCIEILLDKEFAIYDDEEDKRCYLTEENGQFIVLNPREEKITFLSVDACLFDSSDGSRSDCIVYDEELFCFIELKNCKNKNIKANRSKAKKQLIATIDFFTKNLALEQKLEAYICISCSSDDAGFIMTPRADNMEAISEFDELYNTALFYKCQKKF